MTASRPTGASSKPVAKKAAPKKPAPKRSAPKKPAADVRDSTKDRIIAAALACLREEGIVGISARAIARRGDFNQALIFYHFGSVDSLLVAASQAESRERAQRYASLLDGVTSLPDLVAVARQLHDGETETGSTAMLVQLMAGAAHSDELRAGLVEGFTPWMDLVEGAVHRVLADTAFADLVPVADISFVIASLFLGMDLVTGLDHDTDRVGELFTTMERFGTLIDMLIRMMPPGVTLPVIEPPA